MIEQVFRQRAQRYCDLVESLGSGKPADGHELAGALAELYAAALLLPHPQPAGKDVDVDDRAAWHAVRDGVKAAFPDADQYWTLFDPGAEEAPVAASLADDLADVYLDLKRGFRVLESTGEIAQAVWEWRDSFWSHWGRHAIEALRAMHNRVVSTV
jgi:hypothetical protein